MFKNKPNFGKKSGEKSKLFYCKHVYFRLGLGGGGEYSANVKTTIAQKSSSPEAELSSCEIDETKSTKVRFFQKKCKRRWFIVTVFYKIC